MANVVVLGDLSLYRSLDVFYGGALLPSTTTVKKLVLTSSVMTIGTDRFKYLVDTRDNGGNSYVSLNRPDQWAFAGCSVSVNGNPVSNLDPAVESDLATIEIIFDTAQPVLSVFSGVPSGDLELWEGYSSEVIGYDGSNNELFNYSSQGSFGNTSIGDLTLVNPVWWKKGVDEVYATPTAYKSTLVSPLTEDQEVYYTDATPFYPSDDVFWNPYNQDLTYSFTVSPFYSAGMNGVYTFSSLDFTLHP